MQSHQNLLAERLEKRVEDAEHKLSAARDALENQAIASDPARLTEAASHVETVQAEVDTLYERWAELGGGGGSGMIKQLSA